MLRELSMGYMITFILATFSVGLLGADNSIELRRFDSDHFKATGYLPQGVSLEQLEVLLENSQGSRSEKGIQETMQNDNFVLISEEKELFFVTPSIRDKRDFTYNDDSDLIQVLEQKWQNSDWVNNVKEILNYGEDHVLDGGAFHIWQNNAWQDGNAYTNEYNAEGQLTTEVYTTPTGGNYFRNLYTYDAHGNMTELISEVWNVSQVWGGSLLASYTYDENNNLIELETSYYMGDSYVVAERTTYTYNDNNRLMEELIELHEDGQWFDYYRAELVYNENGQHVQSNGFLADGSEWDNNRLMTWTYDEDNNNIDYLMEASYDGGNTWEDFIHETRVFQLPVSISNDEVVSRPAHAELQQNFPNPFNPSTTIRYGLPAAENVSLVIYDVSGQVLQTLASGYQSAGWYNATWNGETADGRAISTGIYFAKLQAGDHNEVIKMLYVK